MSLKIISFFILFVLLSFPFVNAHGVEVAEDLSQNILPEPMVFIQISTAIILGSIIISVIFRERLTSAHKKTLFVIIAVPIIFTTVYLAGDTVYDNLISETGGPVHWHADYEIWACGEKIELAGPESAFENKVGNAVIHHHVDDRIHIEGALRDLSDARLDEFFHIIGGELTQESVTLKTKDGLKTWKNGDNCPSGPGIVQAFVYTTNLDVFTQRKLDNWPEYLISPHSNVPPGDCVIIEFDSELKEKTDKICPSYEIAIERGDIHG